ncbi:MerR family transcriptional regulator [uncultured Ilyobacter sp.]|uniref:MerR family transcriptional regulator n=1 Tax=uncultured Ilyobacter sp. TaxID=544433 RepID=UPI0029F51C36|nr:MerR family transcriptional regulator [uncultured Ilyobacter sp.]
MNIDEVAKYFHITKSKLRYYEKNGVIRKIARDKSDNRVYTKDDLLWIEFFLNLKETGMSLKEIRHYISLKKGGIETVDERKKILLDHVELIEEKIQELIVTREDLQEQIKKYDEEKGMCIIKCSSDIKN